MRKSFIALVFLAVCPLLVAQQALNNDAIVKLAKAGLSDDLIVSTIYAQPGTYATGVNDLIALKAAGVSDKVVSAIVAKVAAASQPAPASIPPLAPMPASDNQAAAASQQAAGNPDDPTVDHEAGIYIYSESAPAGSKMAMLEPSVYSQGKSGGFLASAMTYGIAKIKMKAVLRGAHANARVSDPQPVFYFYFETKSAGLSQSSSPFGGTSTPNEYTLLKFDVKGETRETLVGSMNAFGGSGGTDDKAVTSFTYTKLRPGVYKVMLNGALQPGEYGFISASGVAVVSPYGGGAATNSRV